MHHVGYVYAVLEFAMGVSSILTGKFVKCLGRLLPVTLSFLLAIGLVVWWLLWIPEKVAWIIYLWSGLAGIVFGITFTIQPGMRNI